ncbi:hypothetical protein [Spongorhabdus nitratireducens]
MSIELPKASLNPPDITTSERGGEVDSPKPISLDDVFRGGPPEADINFVRRGKTGAERYWRSSGVSAAKLAAFNNAVDSLLNPEQEVDSRSADFIAASFPYLCIPDVYGGIGLPPSCFPYAAEMTAKVKTSEVVYPAASWTAATLISLCRQAKLKDSILPMLARNEVIATLCLQDADSSMSPGGKHTRAMPSPDDGIYYLEGAKIVRTLCSPDQVGTGVAPYFIHVVEAEIEGNPTEDNPNRNGLFLVCETSQPCLDSDEIYPEGNKVLWQPVNKATKKMKFDQHVISFNFSVGYLLEEAVPSSFPLVCRLGAATQALCDVSSMMRYYRRMLHTRLYSGGFFSHTVMPWSTPGFFLVPHIAANMLGLLEAEVMIQRDRIYQAFKYLDKAVKTGEMSAWADLAMIAPLLRTGDGNTCIEYIAPDNFRAEGSGIVNVPNYCRTSGDVFEGSVAVSSVYLSMIPRMGMALACYDHQALQIMKSLMMTQAPSVFEAVATPLISIMAAKDLDPERSSELFSLIDGGAVSRYLSQVATSLDASGKEQQEAVRQCLDTLDRIDALYRIHQLTMRAQKKIGKDENATYHRRIESNMDAMTEQLGLYK